MGRIMAMPPVLGQHINAAMLRLGLVEVHRKLLRIGHTFMVWKKKNCTVLKLYCREDCAPGTCFEGACPGHKIYSTDGTCGPVDNSLRLCAGKWGDCCDFNGTCGTGPDYCGADKCSFGNCVRPANFGIREPLGPWPKMGNTTDGTCGEPNKFSCNVVFGNCCNKDGVCGSDASDCGEGW